MGELKVTLSDKIILLFLGIFVFALLFNVAYAAQHELKGFFAVPMWLIFIMICLVAKPMRDQKLIAYIGLLVLGVALEYYRATATVKGRAEFDVVKFTILVVSLYGMVLWYFLSLLFARLDRLLLEWTTHDGEVKGLSEESVRVAKAVEKAHLAPDASQVPEYLGPAANYALYRRAFSDLIGLRTAKELPGYLARTLKDGFGIDRGLIVELGPAKQAVVREAWGEAVPKAGAAIAAIKFPQSLIDMVMEKMGAVLHGELEQEGSHTTDLAMLSDANLEPTSLFPIITRDGGREGEERITHLLASLAPSSKAPGSAAEWAESMDGVANQMPKPKVELRIIPVQTILDVTGQFVSRLKSR